MYKTISTLLSVFLISFCTLQSCRSQATLSNSKTSKNTIDFTVLQFNTWGEGTHVENGFSAIINEILAHKPDFVTLSEAKGEWTKQLVDSLSARGEVYYTFTTNRNPSLISRYPIVSHSDVDDYRADPIKDKGHGLSKAVVSINQQEVAIYSAHLDYTHYACYLPRGYDGISWKKLPEPVTNVDKIMAQDAGSTRLSNIMNFIEAAQDDIANNRIVILGGDFNEPSHLDWTEATKDMFDHHGAVVPWRVSKVLQENGFIDTYRAVYPNEVDYPGFTWVVKKTWTPLADERDRIDFIYYHANDKITLTDSKLLGPKESIVRNELVEESSKENILLPQGIWPSDHRAVLSKFKLKL